MSGPRQKLRRVAIDAAGYLLILAALLTGWLPGPGGIPLLIAGLGLLSIHNAWARRLREYAIRSGNDLIHKFFPDYALVQLLYDIIVTLALATAGILLWLHHEYWQLAIAGLLVGLGIVVGLLNRQRYARFMQHIKHKL